MFARIDQIRHCAWMLVVALAMGLHAQDGKPVPSFSTSGGLSAHDELAGDAKDGSRDPTVSREFLRGQIRNLSSASYRAREMAIWQLEQQPALAIEIISELLPGSDLNTGSQLIELLSKFAMRPELTIGYAAMEALQKAAADRISSLAHLAQNSLQAIADVQETQAVDILTQLGAEIGQPPLMINGMKHNSGQGSTIRVALIDARYKGTTADSLRLRFLQQIDTVYLHEIRVDEHLAKAICQMPNLKTLVLSRASITIDDLKIFLELKNLDHFELSYVDLGDEAVPIIENLPVWGSMRLFGTKITKAGGERLKEALDGLILYFGRGGFLGVGTTHPMNLILREVQVDSAAARADLRSGDRLTQINAVTIKTFEDLRAQLAKYGSGEKVQIQFQREHSLLTTEVTLGEAPVPSGER